MKERLFIFDLDGTLYDTREVNYRAYRLALRDFGVELDRSFFYTRCNGLFYKHFLPWVAPWLSERDMAQIHDQKKILYRACLDAAVVNENLIQIIRSACTDCFIALVTTASKRNTFDLLEHFRHDTLFDFIVTQEDVAQKKPDPEGFLLAMRHFQIAPFRTLIFEDSDSGIQAAQESGASVCRVLDYL